jgi:hypothetical protein
VTSPPDKLKPEDIIGLYAEIFGVFRCPGRNQLRDFSGLEAAGPGLQGEPTMSRPTSLLAAALPSTQFACRWCIDGAKGLNPLLGQGHSKRNQRHSEC